MEIDAGKENEVKVAVKEKVQDKFSNYDEYKMKFPNFKIVRSGLSAIGVNLDIVDKFVSQPWVFLSGVN